jgi:hypothetical protein
MEAKYQRALEDLALLQNEDLSILRLAEPVSSAVSEAQKRTSDASTDGNENPSPASLSEDLNHYKVIVILISVVHSLNG